MSDEIVKHYYNTKISIAETNFLATEGKDNRRFKLY
jgi:hypothetical protein